MLATLRTLVGAVVSSLLVMGLALWFVISDRAATPDLLWPAIVLLVGAGATALIQTVGFRTSATSPQATPDDADRQARAAFQSGTVSRLAIAEVPAIASLVLAFVVPRGGYLVYLLGAAVSLILLALYVWPSEGTIARTQRSLEREGGRADLAAALGR